MAIRYETYGHIDARLKRTGMTGFYIMDNLALIFYGWMILVIIQTLLWIVQLSTKDASTADVGWALGMPILVGWYAWHLDGYPLRQWMIFLPIVIWSLRLSFYLIFRIMRDHQEDSRYARLRERLGHNAERKFLIVFQLQPIFNVILAIPFFIICQNQKPEVHTLEILGLLLWVISFAGEVTSDHQLSQFRQKPSNKGKICQDGLWNYSRHPNFFFEWMMWVSYFVYALASPYGLIAVISPAFMLFLLMKVTGIPVIEKHALKTKGEAFREYQRTTSFFVPLPKKNHKK